MRLTDNPEKLQLWFELDRDELDQRYGAVITTKAKHRWFWNILDGTFWLFNGCKETDFMKRATTIGCIMAFSEDTNLEHITLYEYVILKHMTVHVKQCATLGMGETSIGVIPYLLLYLFVPLPILFSWFRFKFERDAFIVEHKFALKCGWTPNIEDYVQALKWAWPEAKVRAWFKAALQSMP